MFMFVWVGFLTIREPIPFLSYEIAHLSGMQVSCTFHSSLSMQQQTPGMFFNQP